MCECVRDRQRERERGGLEMDVAGKTLHLFLWFCMEWVKSVFLIVQDI